jgi:hypothetical protein
MQHVTTAELKGALVTICAAPADEGTIELIVRRPGPGQRELLDVAELDLELGLVGDTWSLRGSSSTPDGRANPEAQITMMNARVIGLLARSTERWALAGDQLYVELDLSVENLPPGTRLAFGDAVIEVSTKPHTGCAKFRDRFGVDAVRFVNAQPELRLRGANTKVVVAGAFRRGDTIRKV